jgi:hypothetical protein
MTPVTGKAQITVLERLSEPVFNSHHSTDSLMPDSYFPATKRTEGAL